MEASELDELPPDFQFGGYVVRQCIGRGGMARVYRAEHVALRKPVALKLLDIAMANHAAGMRRFLGEARAAAAVKHQNVVEIMDVGVWEERPFIVMELLDGVDLERHLALRGALSESEVVALALPVIAGMSAVHDVGVIHRDLKPSNIFLVPSSEGELTPKVLDFGISKLSERLQDPGQRPTGTQEIIGTPEYMAPEALDGLRKLGPAADQYSLGVVLYECAVGRPPFEGETLLQLLRAIAVGVFTSPRAIRPELSPALEAVIERAMSVIPQQRFRSLREMGRALLPLADERTRVIWERAFGDTGPDDERVPTVDLGLVHNRVLLPSARSRWALAAALGASAALAGGWWLLRDGAGEGEHERAQLDMRTPASNFGDPRPVTGNGVRHDDHETAEHAESAPAVPPSTVHVPVTPRTEATKKQPARERRAKYAARNTASTKPGVSRTGHAAFRDDPDLAKLFEAKGPAPEPSADSDTSDEHAEGRNHSPILD